MTEERKSRYELFLEEEERKAQPTKRCPKCKEVRALSDFGVRRASRDGLSYICKGCNKARYKRKHKNSEDRFWKFYHSHTNHVGGCVEWKARYYEGCPICFFKGRDSAMVRRVVYTLAVGILPDDARVLPNCGNKRCVRQSHLKLFNANEYQIFIHNNYSAMGDKNGTHTKPNRIARGERQGSSKLTEQNVIFIRETYQRKEYTQLELAHMFAVSISAISKIILRKAWAHVPDEATE